MLLKICGTTNPEDARLISKSGADFCGILVDVNFSERSLSLEQARQVASASTILNVILMCDPDIKLVEAVATEIKPHAIQLLSHESPEFLSDIKKRVNCQIWKTIHLPPISGQASPEDYIRAGADAILIDSVDTSEGFQRLGGTGQVADWGQAAEMVKTLSVPVFLAGGINPDNVAQAMTTVRPWGIDLCSGVEVSRGKKDPEKLRELVRNFKDALAEIERG